MKIKITEIEVNATDLKASQTSELEKALAENREETIDAWLADAKRALRKIAESIESAVERKE